MKRIILQEGEEYRILRGHPWVFNNEVAAIVNPQGDPVSLEAGEIVDVESSRRTYVGRALANPHSKIIARIYSPSKEGIDRGFFINRLRRALEWRNRWYDLSKTSVRVVFAEADTLPGLIIDRYVGWSLEEVLTLNNQTFATSSQPLSADDLLQQLGQPGVWYVVQFLSYGMDQRKNLILEALEQILGPAKGIIERDDTAIRTLERLPLWSGLLQGSFPREGICIIENNFLFVVDLLGGQKTGYFLDQRENRSRLATYVRPASSVLDLCCHTGGFSIHAARYGAAEVLAVDSSAEALKGLARNAQLNGVTSRINTLQGDVFEVIRDLGREKRRFDTIILDPPAFAKTKQDLPAAIRGYGDLNRQAIELLKPGGFLVTCSCSQAMTETTFKAMMERAAADADRQLRLAEFRYQSFDHPILVGYDESLYLKCGIYQVLR